MPDPKEKQKFIAPAKDRILSKGFIAPEKDKVLYNPENDGKFSLKEFSEGYVAQKKYEDNVAIINKEVDSLENTNDDEKQYLKDSFNKIGAKIGNTDKVYTIEDWNESKKIMNDEANPAFEVIKNAGNIFSGTANSGKPRTQYYFDENGLPKALKFGEKPPKNAKVESIWGNYKSTENDDPTTTGAKAFYNTAVDVLKTIPNIYNIAQGLVTGEESEAVQTLENGIDRLKFDKKEPGSIINTEKVDSFGDLLKADTWNVNAQSSANFVGTLLGYVAQFAMGGRAVGVNRAATTAGKFSRGAGASIAISMDEALNQADEAGLTGRDKFTVAGITAVGTGLLELVGGPEMMAMGGATKKVIANSVAKEVISEIAKQGGKLTAETLETAFKSSLKAGSKSMLKTFVKEGAKEGLEEATQTYYQEAVQQIYDKTHDNKFNADLSSPKVFAEALEGVIGGALMGGFGGVVNPNKQGEQAKDIYRAIKLGKEQELIQQFHNMKVDGKMTENDYTMAVDKVKELKTYIDKVKHLPVEEDAKARAAQIIFEDKNLEESIKQTEGADQKDITIQAQIKAMQKQRNDYLNELTDIYSGTWGKEEGSKKEPEKKPEVKKEEKPVATKKETKSPEEIKLDEQIKAIAEGKKKPSVSKVDELYGRSVSLNIGKERKTGRVFKDAENTIVFEDETGKEYDIGKEQTFNETRLSEIDPTIEQDNLEKINVSDDGKSITIDGKDYVNDTEIPENAITKTKKGYSINLKTKDGKSRTFRGQGAEDIAYVFIKRKFSEQVTDSEEHLAELDAIIKEVDEDEKLNPTKYEPNQTEVRPAEKTTKESTGKSEKPVTEEKDGNNEQVSQTEQVEEKVTEAKADSENAREYVKHLDGTKYKKSRGTIEKRPGTKIKNNVYDFVDEAGHRLKLASWKYLKNISKDISGTKVQSRLITPEDENLGSYEDNVRALANGKKVFTFRLFNRKDNTTRDQDYPFIIRLTDMKTGKDIANLRVTDYGEQPGKPAKEKPITPKVGPETPETKPSTKNNVKTDTNEESTTTQTKSAPGNDKETWAESTGQAKTKAVRVGTKKSQRKIKHPEKLQALNHEVFTPYDIALQYFIRGGQISSQAVKSLFKGSDTERRARISYTRQNAPSVKDIAHALWEEHADALSFDTGDFENAVEEAVTGHNSPTSMAKELNKNYSEKGVPFTIPETEMNEVYEQADNDGLGEAMDEVVEALEELSDEKIIELAEDQKVVDDFVEKLDLPDDIIRNEGIEDQFQKETTDNKENVDKVVKVIQKALPKVTVKYNSELKAAGVLRADGKTIEINPYYAGIDTPIHESGHVLIDAMGGLKNDIIKQAVKQLKDTTLWNETKERYPELSEDMLAKEVLAEAIGREGASIFDTEAKKKKFQHLLDYIFNWLKTKLGINKNIAKSLSKQIIGGVGTKNMTGTTEAKQKIKEEAGEDPEEKRQRLEERAVNKIQKALKKRFKTWEDYASSKGHNDVTFTIEKENLDDEIDVTTNPDKKAELQARRDAMNEVENAYKEEFKTFNSDMKAIQAMIETDGEIGKLPLNKLTDWYWILNKYRYDIDGNTLFNKIKDRIGMQMRNLRAEEIKEAFPDFDIEKYEKEDLTPSDVYMKGITDMTEKQPELQFLETTYKEAIAKNNLEFEAILKESKELAKEVINEYNHENGVTGRAARLVNPFHENSKYFSYMEDPNIPGQYKKVNDPSLSPAQANLLAHILKTKNKAEFKKAMAVDGITLDDNAVIKMDANTTEQFKKRGWFAAWSKMLGNTYNIRQHEVEFQNPETKVNSKMQFGDVETWLEDYSKKGQTQKLNSIYLLRKYSKLAEKESLKGSNELKGNAKYYIGKNGLVTSAYSSENDQYSKDFYNAYLSYMQDAVFAKNMNEVLPYLHGAENLEKVMGKTNASNFLEIWKKGHITKEEIVSKFGRTPDKVLKFFRLWTHARVMAFNLPAGLFNLIVGKYNQYRAQDGDKILTGEKLMAKSFASDGWKNGKAFNIARAYQAAGPEQNLNPDKHIGRFFSMFMYGASSITETWIQYSSFLSQMSKEEYSWHDKQGNITGDTPEIIAERNKHMIKQARRYKDKIQSVQGKYAPEYRRNFTLFELGRTIGQFKIWMPETYLERFGNTYINSNNEKVTGSVRSIFKAGFRDAYKYIYKKEFYISDEEKYVLARKNMKDLIAVAGVMSLLLGASDDDDDKLYANSLDRLIGDMTSVYNLKTYAYMVTNPMPAMKTTSDLIKTVQQVYELQEYKSGKKKGDLKAVISIHKLGPYHKIGDVAADLFGNNE